VGMALNVTYNNNFLQPVLIGTLTGGVSILRGVGSQRPQFLKIANRLCYTVCKSWG